MERHKPMEYSKLTPEQQEFAEANHNLIYSYLIKYRLPYEEYYDLVAIGYVKAVQIYCERSDLKKYSFSIIFWQKAKSTVADYWRRCKKNSCVPNSALCSLDVPEIRSALEYDGIQAAEPLWEDIGYRDLVDRICQYATGRQRQILQMLLSGYTNTEIQQTIGIGSSTFWRDRQHLRERIVELGILEPRYMATKR